MSECSVSVEEQDGLCFISIACWFRKIYEVQHQFSKIDQSFKIRLLDHAPDIKHNRSSSYTPDEHSINIRHHICIKYVKILTNEDQFLTRNLGWHLRWSTNRYFSLYFKFLSLFFIICLFFLLLDSNPSFSPLFFLNLVFSFFYLNLYYKIYLCLLLFPRVLFFLILSFSLSGSILFFLNFYLVLFFYFNFVWSFIASFVWLFFARLWF